MGARERTTVDIRGRVNLNVVGSVCVIVDLKTRYGIACVHLLKTARCIATGTPFWCSASGGVLKEQRMNVPNVHRGAYVVR